MVLLEDLKVDYLFQGPFASGTRSFCGAADWDYCDWSHAFGHIQSFSDLVFAEGADPACS